MTEINWEDPTSMISTHFSVNDAIFLPSWKRLANESDGLTDEVKENLVNLMAKMEVVRQFLGNRAIIVHCAFRPVEYNKLIGGALNSPHLTGRAIDYHVDGLAGTNGCDYVRGLLEPKLQEFQLRMEDISNMLSRNWIHNDNIVPHPNYYFKP